MSDVSPLVDVDLLVLGGIVVTMDDERRVPPDRNSHDERGLPDAVGPVDDLRGEVTPAPADDAIEHAGRR